MSFFWGDGFDCYALPADALLGYWDSGTTGFALGSGRFPGSRSAVFSSSGSAYVVKSSGSNDAIHHIVCAYQQTAAISGTTLGLYFQLTDNTTNQCCIVFRSDGAILLTSATPGGTVLATYTGAVPVASTWYAFEFEVVIHNTAGSFAVRKNGNTSNDFSAGSLNTRPGTNSYANKITFGAFSALTSAIDDLLWRSDAASVPWVGDIRCYTRRPASDAAVAWSPSGTPAGLTQTWGGGSRDDSYVNTVMRLEAFTCLYTGTITTVTFSTTVAVSGNIKAAIWADNAGVPGVVLGSSASQAVTPVGNNPCVMTTPVPVVAGQKIWVGALGSASGGNWNSVSTPQPGSINGTAVGSFATFPQPNPVYSSSAQAACSILYGAPTGNALRVADQQQDAAASYVYSSTVGQSDLYTLTGIDSTPTSIIGVTTRALAQKSDAGTRIITADLKSGGTTVHSGSGVLNTTWSWTYRTDLTDPNTGAAWTPTGVNNAQIGVTVTA